MSNERLTPAVSAWMENCGSTLLPMALSQVNSLIPSSNSETEPGVSASTTVSQTPSERTELGARSQKQSAQCCHLTVRPPSVKRKITPPATANLTSSPWMALARTGNEMKQPPTVDRAAFADISSHWSNIGRSLTE